MRHQAAWLLITLVFCIPLAPLAGDARPPAKVPRIGILTPAAEASTPAFEAFRRGLCELGYVEGQNIVLEFRFAAGRAERLPELAAELVQLPVDVILRDGGAAAPLLQLQLQLQEVPGPDAIEAAFAAATKGQADALITLPDAMLWNQRTQIADLAAEHRLPALFPEREFVDVGGLISCGLSVPATFHRAAVFVDKILKGPRRPTCRWNSPASLSWSST